MKQQKLKPASNGDILCHFWREGEEYYRQKSPVFLKEFNNVQFSVYPEPPDCPYLHHDVTQTLPFPEACFDHINSYHIFEHLSLKEGHAHCRDLYQILKPGGILRVSVPDLEMISREYLEYLEKSLQNPSESNLQRYKWAVYELIDQATRTKSGGLMMESILSGDYDENFILDRYSDVFEPILGKRRESEGEAQPNEVPAKRSFLQKLRRVTPGKLRRKLDWMCFVRAHKKKLEKVGSDPRKTKEAVRWMHDRLSLTLMLEACGFVDVKQMDFKSSDIPDWKKYDLDRSNYGERAIDPGIYIECRKPA